MGSQRIRNIESEYRPAKTRLPETISASESAAISQRLANGGTVAADQDPTPEGVMLNWKKE